MKEESCAMISRKGRHDGRSSLKCILNKVPSDADLKGEGRMYEALLAVSS